MTANTYAIDFIQFKIRDMDTNEVIFQAESDPNLPNPALDVEKLKGVPDEARFIRYHFAPDFLQKKSIGTRYWKCLINIISLTFRVGPKPIPNFRMIERHYFKTQLVKSFDFTFGFCIPNSTNSWEVIYDMPTLNEKLSKFHSDFKLIPIVKEMIANPFEIKSDSFYFVNNQLVMHNKSEYSYAPFEDDD